METSNTVLSVLLIKLLSVLLIKLLCALLTKLLSVLLIKLLSVLLLKLLSVLLVKLCQVKLFEAIYLSLLFTVDKVLCQGVSMYNLERFIFWSHYCSVMSQQGISVTYVIICKRNVCFTHSLWRYCNALLWPHLVNFLCDIQSILILRKFHEFTVELLRSNNPFPFICVCIVTLVFQLTSLISHFLSLRLLPSQATRNLAVNRSV